MAKRIKEANEINSDGTYFNEENFPVGSFLDLALGWIDEPLNRVVYIRNGIDKKCLWWKSKELSGLELWYPKPMRLGVSTKALQRKEPFFDTIQSEKIYDWRICYATGGELLWKKDLRRWNGIGQLFSIGNRKPLELIDVSAGIALLRMRSACSMASQVWWKSIERLFNRILRQRVVKGRICLAGGWNLPVLPHSIWLQYLKSFTF